MDKDKDREPGTGNRERETLADIAADIRDRAVVADRHGDRETSNESVAALLRDIANRIDAAATREREAASLRAIHAVEIAIRDAAPGNAAAMRFALADIEFGSNYCIERCNTNSEADDVLRFILGKILDIVKPALVAPPRNCDKFNKNDCVDAFIREFGDREIDIDRATPEQYDAFMREHWFLFKIWLYANAKKNGGAQ